MRRPGVTLAGAACALALAASPAAGQPAPELVPIEAGQGLGGVTTQLGVVTSPDTRHVYGADTFAVYGFRRGANGKLTHVDTEPVTTPQQIAISPDGKHVYVSASPGAIACYARDSATGTLTFVENEIAQLEGSAADVEVSRDGAEVYATSPGQDGLLVYARDAATGQLTFEQRLLDGEGGASGLVAAARLAVSPDDRHVYVTGLYETAPGPPPQLVDSIATYERQQDGTLAFASLIREGVGGTVGLDGISNLAIAPDGGEVLALDPVPGLAGILRFARDGDSGALSFVDEWLPSDDAGPVVHLPYWFALRDDGARLYLGAVADVTGGGVGNAVQALGRAADGSLSYLAQGEGSGFDGATGGRWIYTTGVPGLRVFAPEADGAAAALSALALLALRKAGRRPRGASARG